MDTEPDKSLIVETPTKPPPAVSADDVRLFLAMGKWLPWVALTTAVSGGFLEFQQHAAWDADWMIWPFFACLALAAIMLLRAERGPLWRVGNVLVIITASLQLLVAVGFTFVWMTFIPYRVGTAWFTVFALLPIMHGITALSFSLTSRRVGERQIARLWALAALLLILGYGTVIALIHATTYLSRHSHWQTVRAEYGEPMIEITLWGAFIPYAVAAILTSRAARRRGVD